MKIPEFLNELLINQYDEEQIKKIIDGYSKARKTTLRVNTLKTTIEYVKEVLTLNNIKYSLVNWYDKALIIENVTENEIRNLDIYKQGLIYLQSLSSMIPALILDVQENDRILDMTAAPGGKTTQMSTINNCYITACEKNKIRCDRLKYNIEKQGANKVTVLNTDARDLDDLFMFDKILLDAPCSGSGTICLNDDLEKYFNINLINKSVQIQFELLEKAIKLLKKDCTMVYSTCSILTKENEEQLNKIMKKHNLEIIEIDKSKFDGVPFMDTAINGTVCICPNELYEGFFVSKIRKK